MTLPVHGPADHTQSEYGCDCLVIGSGPGGSTAAWRLARAGKKVIVLEEGGLFPAWRTAGGVGEMTRRLYRNAGVLPFVGKPLIPCAEGRCVGGGSIINGGLFWRTPPWVLEEWRTRFGLDGYGQDDLAPHFDALERVLSVTPHGPDEPGNEDSKLLGAAADRLGWKAVYAPRALKGCDNSNLCATGCPPGAKQTMLETLLPDATRHGAEVFTHCKAERIISRHGRAVAVRARVAGTKRRIDIRFDDLFLAAGSLRTPSLLAVSGLGRRLAPIRFHLNLKVVARFNQQINAQDGTMFTVQVQEFERQNVLIMASNLLPQYLCIAMAPHGMAAVDTALGGIGHHGLYVAMVRPRQLRAKLVVLPGGEPLVLHRLGGEDVETMRFGLARTAQALFEAGAEELFLPMPQAGPVKDLAGATTNLARLSPANADMITVHIMASCPMRGEGATGTDLDGLVRGTRNVRVVDASMLPGTIGESPQGTIMAMAMEILRRYGAP